MRRFVSLWFCAIALLVPAVAAAQVGITPRIGAYVQAGDLDELEDEVENIEVSQEAALALGATLDLGRYYASVDYVTGSTLTDDGIDNGDDLGDGSLLAIAAGLVLRAPTPVIQPHLRIGAGIKRHEFSFDNAEFDDLFPDDLTEFALHGAVGATVGLGGMGLALEVGDYITVDGFSPHDLMLTAGLRLGF